MTRSVSISAQFGMSGLCARSFVFLPESACEFNLVNTCQGLAGWVGRRDKLDTAGGAFTLVYGVLEGGYDVEGN